MLINNKYFVTTAGTVTLPVLNGSTTQGQAVIVAKLVGISVFINVGDISDIIETDLGPTNSIEFDATQECIFIASGANTWNLQIGSVN